MGPLHIVSDTLGINKVLVLTRGRLDLSHERGRKATEVQGPGGYTGATHPTQQPNVRPNPSNRVNLMVRQAHTFPPPVHSAVAIQ